MKCQITVTIDQEIVDEIDNRRGLVPRAAAINELLKEKIAESPVKSCQSQPGETTHTCNCNKGCV